MSPSYLHEVGYRTLRTGKDKLLYIGCREMTRTLSCEDLNPFSLLGLTLKNSQSPRIFCPRYVNETALKG